MSVIPDQQGNGPHGSVDQAQRGAKRESQSFRVLLWVCCGIIDVILVAGLVWWLMD